VQPAEPVPSGIPAAWRQLYEQTGGISISGFLPERPTGQMTFKLLKAADVVTWRQHLLQTTPTKPAWWHALPHWVKVLTAGPTAESIWRESWYPFAHDGAGSFQFADQDGRGAIYQYDPSWQVRRCAPSLPAYFSDVAAAIAAGKLKPFHLD
jgi:hypothetical protein